MRRILFLLGATLAVPASYFAQTTFATVTGMITDPSGAVIPGSTVTVTKLDSNYQYTSKSNDSGIYSIGQLLEGDYNLRAESPGFKIFIEKNIRIGNQEVRRIDIRMETGAVETTVEVSGTAGLIETESARISDTKTANVIKDLPLNQRSLWDFVGQNPGVVQAASSSATRRFSGSRNNQSDASVDGITISNGRDGTQVSPLVNYVESMAEVRVDMANNSAEFGGLGQVTVISKSGSNNLHATGFDYYQTPKFVSRNPFASSGSAGITHWPGFTIGGPVYIPRLYNGKNRTFFFYSYETARGSAVHDLINPTVPLANWRNGDFSNLLPSTIIKDPFNGNAPFAGNVIPASRLNPVAQKIQSLYYPLPNYGNTNVFQSQNFRELLTRPFDPSEYWTTRLDHRFSDRDFLFGRFTWAFQYSRGWDDNLPTIGRIQNQRENQGANVSYSHSFSPNLLNEFRWGVAYNDQPRNGAQNGPQVVKDLGLQGLAPNLPDIAGIFQVGWTGLGIQSITQQVWRHPGFKNQVYQFQDNLSWYRGRHTLKAGFVVSRTLYADGQVPTAGSLVSGGSNLFGSATFSNRFTGYPYADFLLGIPTTSARSFPNFVDRELRWSYDLFVTDEFKISPKLTMSVGLRYELHPVAKNVDGYNSIFDIGTGKIVVPDGSISKISSLLPANYVGVQTASAAGLPNSLIYTDRNNFAPRFSLAWRPLGPNTVIRSGFGIFYDIVPETPSANTVPFAIDQPSYTNPATNPNVILPLVYPNSSGGPATISLPAAVNPHIIIPYSMQYNFTIEHQRGDNAFRVSYIGTNTRHGDYSYNINQPLPSTGLFINQPRAFQTYPAINYLTNGAGHQYNGFTAEVKRRGTRGLTYQLSYTLAKDIGDLERGQSPENAYNRARERQPWLDIPKNSVTGNVIWELPFGRGKRFLANASGFASALLSGWSTSWIYTFRSGRYLTPMWTGPDPAGTAYTTTSAPATVTIRPNCLSNPNLPSGQQSLNGWFNAAAFAPPTTGQFGTCGGGVIIGPHLNVFDTGLFKNFRIKERVNIRFEITAVNIWNHPNYNDPTTNISQAGNVGVISGVGGSSLVSGASSPLDPSGARAFRTGLRVEF
jgi:hypothetical protein